MTEEAHSAIVEYARSARQDRKANPGKAGDGTGLELLLAPRFLGLLQRLVSLRVKVSPPRVLPEYQRSGIGRPDVAFKREGEPARSFIELKQPDASIAPSRLRGHDKEQFKRFSELPLWGFCNFHTIHLYRRKDLREQAVILPAIALDPETSDAHADRLIRRHDPQPFLVILDALALASPPSFRNPKEIAEGAAHAARVVRGIVADQCRAGAPPALDAVRAEFRETLFAHAASGGYDTSDENALFANAFAQTLAFGLLLAREAAAHGAARLHEPMRELDRDAYRLLPNRAYPLLRATLRALTQDEILDLLGAGFDVLLDTVNAVDPVMLASRAGADPILYFYEDFLTVVDPEAKKRHGVFFTPVPVVRFMVAATNRALREHLAPQSLLDPNVLLLDPACGTGTFLIAALNAGAEMARAAYGEGAIPAEKAALAQRLHGLELLVGPYTVAHYRMLHELPPDGLPDSRLPIYFADTLTPPTGAVGITSRLGFMAVPIVEERRAADALKRDTPIIAIIGNPPYRRLDEGEERGITSGWDNGFWNDLKEPVRRAGWGGGLNTFPDLYIAFWRWSLWKLFECEGAPRRGVVTLITNRTFLAGHPYAGLRRMLRRRFDLIEIVDLRGDSRGARPAGIEADENVFAIQAGVCITTAVAKGGSGKVGTEARVSYADVWRHDAFTDRSKRHLLNNARLKPSLLTYVDVNRSDLEDFLPRPFEGLNWPAIPELFAFFKSGSKTQRDDLVYGFSTEEVIANIVGFLDSSEEDAERLFFSGQRRATRRPTI